MHFFRSSNRAEFSDTGTAINLPLAGTSISSACNQARAEATEEWSLREPIASNSSILQGHVASVVRLSQNVANPVSKLALLVVAGAVKNADGVGKEFSEGVERLNGTFGAAGKIQDERTLAHHGDAAGKHGGGRLLSAFAAHLFGEAGNDFFGNLHSGLRRVVPRAQSCAAGGEDQIRLARIG